MYQYTFYINDQEVAKRERGDDTHQADVDLCTEWCKGHAERQVAVHHAGHIVQCIFDWTLNDTYMPGSDVLAELCKGW